MRPANRHGWRSQPGSNRRVPLCGRAPSLSGMRPSYPRPDSNGRPSASEADALSNCATRACVLSTASVREESNLHAGATALRAAGLTTCPTHRWGGWRVLPPLRPDAQSGSSLLGSATSRRRTAGRTRTCTVLIRRQVTYPLDHGGFVSAAGAEPAAFWLSSRLLCHCATRP